MRIRAYSCVAALAVSLAACSAQPVVNPGVVGAGVTTEIVGVDHDSTGYTVRFRMTNHDTGGVGYGACEGVVEVPNGSGWTSVTHWGQCQLWLGILPPAAAVTLSIPQQTLVQGSQIRVALDWAFAFSNGGAANLSTTDPVVVP
jgi:hypothetical protein